MIVNTLTYIIYRSQFHDIKVLQSMPQTNAGGDAEIALGEHVAERTSVLSAGGAL